MLFSSFQIFLDTDTSYSTLDTYLIKIPVTYGYELQYLRYLSHQNSRHPLDDHLTWKLLVFNYFTLD